MQTRKSTSLASDKSPDGQLAHADCVVRDQRRDDAKTVEARPQDFSSPTDQVVLSLARLLGRQFAREFNAETSPASPSRDNV
jgi:hypothetical protein